MITQTELKDILQIPQEYPVCEETVNRFNNYIIESYKLYRELVGLHGHKFSIKVGDENVTLQITIKHIQESQIIDYSFSYQQFVQGYSPTSMNFAVDYINPFDNHPLAWYQTRFEEVTKNEIISQAYRHFVVNIFQEIVERYETHDIQLKSWMLLNKFYQPSDVHYPIRLQGINFLKNLGIIKPDDNYAYISNQDMKQVITCQENVWTTKMHEPVKRIIDSLSTVQTEG